MPMIVFSLSAVILCQFEYVGAIGEYSAFTVLHLKFMYAVHLCNYYY